MRILHVTECYAGGVSRALNARVRALPEMEHHLLWAGTERPIVDQWASEEKMPGGLVGRLGSVRNSIKTLNPDVIHAHSSWAGLYTRAVKSRAPVVYEPHCFKFDDPQLSHIKRTIFREGERILAHRTSAFGVLSDHEKDLVRSIRRTTPIIFLPNVPTLPLMSNLKEGIRPSMLTTVAMIGRICAQKDPDFFLDVLEALRRFGSPLRPVWIGDGDCALRRKLEAHGVRVTGWLTEDQIARELHDAVYFHSAAYEGFPLSVLDAAACDAPIVARSIPALTKTPLFTAADATILAHRIQNLASSKSAQKEASQANRKLLETFNEEGLRAQLSQLYKTVVR